MKLITDPNQARTEVEAQGFDMEAPCTRQEAAAYLDAKFKTDMAPILGEVIVETEKVAEQGNVTANLVNGLMDFMEQRGLRLDKAGRYRLDRQEFAGFMKLRAGIQCGDVPPAMPGATITI